MIWITFGILPKGKSWHVGHDAAGAPEDCGSEDVFVVGVRETVCAFQPLPSEHQGVTETCTHLVGEVTRLLSGGFLAVSALYEFELFVGSATPFLWS